MLLDILSYCIEKNDTKEELRLCRFHSRDEYSGGGTARLGRPVFGLREGEETSPRGGTRYYFERLRERSTLVSSQVSSYSAIYISRTRTRRLTFTLTVYTSPQSLDRDPGLDPIESDLSKRYLIRKSKGCIVSVSRPDCRTF